jgi:hypothetical protein
VADNRRTATRHPVSIAAVLTVEGLPQQCTIVNLSLGGALVQAMTKLSMGAHVAIRYTVPSVKETVDVGATVRWSTAEGTGLQFDGLRARDVWALNEYFKQFAS